jgi:hypothetical protein
VAQAQAQDIAMSPCQSARVEEEENDFVFTHYAPEELGCATACRCQAAIEALALLMQS